LQRRTAVRSCGPVTSTGAESLPLSEVEADLLFLSSAKRFPPDHFNCTQGRALRSIGETATD